MEEPKFTIMNTPGGRHLGLLPKQPYHVFFYSNPLSKDSTGDYYFPKRRSIVDVKNNPMKITEFHLIVTFLFGGALKGPAGGARPGLLTWK